MDDDVDIYADILSKGTITPDKVHVRLEQEIAQLKAALEICQREKSDLQTKNDKLSVNISSLYRTAKSEIRRKNAIIETLRNQQYTHHNSLVSQRGNDKEHRRALEDSQTQLSNVNNSLRDNRRSHSQENRYRSDRASRQGPEDNRIHLNNMNDHLCDDLRSHSQENRHRSDRDHRQEAEDNRTHNINDRFRDNHRSNSHEYRHRKENNRHRRPEVGKLDRCSQDKYNARKTDNVKQELRPHSVQDEYYSQDRCQRLPRENGHLVQREHHRMQRDSPRRQCKSHSSKDHHPNEVLISQDEQYLLEKRRILKECLAEEDHCLREQSKVDKNDKRLHENTCRRRSRPENDVVDSSLADTPMKILKSELTTTAFVKLISPLGMTPDHIKAKFNDMMKFSAGVPTMLNEIRNESCSVARLQSIIPLQNGIKLQAVEQQMESSTTLNKSIPEMPQSQNDAKLHTSANEIESSQSVVQLQNDLISVEHGAFKRKIKRRPVIRIVENKTNVEVESC